MLTPAQAARRRDDTGARLHMPWAAARDLGVYLRLGQLAMLVAGPGVGKSVLALCYAIQSGVRTLYLSLDTDAFTTSVRLLAAVNGWTTDEAEQKLVLQDPEALESLSHMGDLRFSFTSSPDEAEIADRLLAYIEAEGEPPELLVVDNLANVAVDDRDEFGALRRLMRDMQTLAGRIGCSVLVLHHATGEHENGVDPVPIKGVLGKVSKFPSLILTAHRNGRGAVRVDVVKHRFGPANPAAAGEHFTLGVEMDRVQVGPDPAPLTWASER